MRRIYGTLPISFWEHSDIQPLSDQARLLAAYLCTGPHSNMLGCFRLPAGYITEDLKWNTLKIKSAFRELSEANYLTRDNNTAWVVIHDFLISNPIQNPCQGVGIEKVFNALPKISNVTIPTAQALMTYGKYLNEGFVDRLQNILDGVGTVSRPMRADQEQNQNKDQDQNQKKRFMSGEPDAALQKNNNLNQLLKEQAIEILEFLNEKSGRAYRCGDTNLKLIIACLKSGATAIDCRQVIAKKTREWKSDPMMAEYLRPATLFNRMKFEQYLGELVVPKEVSINDAN